MRVGVGEMGRGMGWVGAEGRVEEGVVSWGNGGMMG